MTMALKSHKARDLDLRSVWLLDNQSTFDLVDCMFTILKRLMDNMVLSKLLLII